MKVNIMDFRKIRNYDNNNIPNGILKCLRNKEYKQKEFKAIPRKDEFILLPHEGANDWLFSWRVVGVYYLNDGIFLVVDGLNDILNFI